MSLLSARLGHANVISWWWWHDPGHVNDNNVMAHATMAAWAPCRMLMTSCGGGGMAQGTSSSLFGSTGHAHCAIAIIILWWWWQHDVVIILVTWVVLSPSSSYGGGGDTVLSSFQSHRWCHHRHCHLVVVVAPPRAHCRWLAVAAAQPRACRHCCCGLRYMVAQAPCCCCCCCWAAMVASSGSMAQVTSLSCYCVVDRGGPSSGAVVC